MLQALGFGDRLTREINFSSLKKQFFLAPEDMQLSQGEPRFLLLSVASSSAWHLSTHHPRTTVPYTAHVRPLDTGICTPCTRLEQTGGSLVGIFGRKQPPISCGLGRACLGRRGRGAAVGLSAEAV